VLARKNYTLQSPKKPPCRTRPQGLYSSCCTNQPPTTTDALLLKVHYATTVCSLSDAFSLIISQNVYFSFSLGFSLRYTIHLSNLSLHSGSPHLFSGTIALDFLMFLLLFQFAEHMFYYYWTWIFFSAWTGICFSA
jgi:hypothetical protein